MNIDFEALAKQYSTTSRTIRRWAELGVDVNDALAVARHILSLQRIKTPTIRAAAKLLEKELP